MASFVIKSNVAEAKSEIQYAQQIKALFRTLPRDVFLEIKSISGHLKRISLILNDNKIGIRNFIKSMSNLLGPLVFKTLFKLPVVYQPPSLEVGKSFPIINMDDDLSDFEDELPFKHLESQQSQMGMNLPKTPMSTQMVLSPGVVDLGESYGNLDSDEYEDDGSDDNFYRQSRGASARFNHAFSFDIMDTRQETEDRLRDSLGQLNKNELESFLFQQHLCMTWYGYTLELLVRYWDYIFEKFEIGANKMA
jgi:hypothetical protein